MIHVMAAIGLRGTAMSAPVVGYNAITLVQEEQHLRIPIVGRERPAVAKHDGLTFAPVLVINLDTVFCGDGCHGMTSLICWKSVGADIMHESNAMLPRFLRSDLLTASG